MSTPSETGNAIELVKLETASEGGTEVYVHYLTRKA